MASFIENAKVTLSEKIKEAKAAAREACAYVKANKAKSAMVAAGGLGQVLNLAAKVVPEPAKGYVKEVGEALSL